MSSEEAETKAMHTDRQVQALLTALKRVTADMDRAGGDGYGMPECPWCKCQFDGEIQHVPECELLLARHVIADIEAGIGSADPGVAVAPPLDPRVEMSASVETIAQIIEPWRDGKVLRQRIHAELTRLLESTEQLRVAPPLPKDHAEAFQRGWQAGVKDAAEQVRAVAPPQEQEKA